MDVHDAAQRSRNMAAIRARDTRPELAIRRRLHARGFRYRLHATDVPGKPDLVLPRYRAAILIHGCFWHWHGCRLSKMPATRPEWWREKLKRNRQRDAQVMQQLQAAGWRVLVVWECAFRGTGSPARALDRVAERAAAWLSGTQTLLEIGDALAGGKRPRKGK